MIGTDGHGWGFAVFPLAAAIIALVFAGLLGRRLAGRRRPHEAAWFLALLMYAVGSAAMFAGVLWGWTTVEFRLYWLFGAVLTVPYLAQGEVYLLVADRRVGHAIMALLVAASAFAAWEVLRAPIDTAPLARSLPLGRDSFGDGSAPHRLAQYYALPTYFFLLGGLLWSGLAMRGKPHLRDRTVGTLSIAVGATIVAIGSGIGAAREIVPLFAVALSLGVGVMFWGFLRAGRRPALAPTAPPS